MNVIEMKNVSKVYKRYKKQDSFIKNFFMREYESKKAVDNLNISIVKGEVVGLLGQNGAGKTTTMKLLSGLLCPSEGEISVLGCRPFEKQNYFKKKISLLMGQKQQLWWDISPNDNFKLFKDIYSVSDYDYNIRMNRMVDMLQIQDILKSPVRTLSLGERMKCELVAALLHNPKVLFLDEPTIGLDLVAQKNVRDFVKDYCKENGATAIVTSHNMSDIEEVCNRTIFIDDGKKLFDGNLNDFIEKYGKECYLNIEVDLEKIKSATDVAFVKGEKIVKADNNIIKIRVLKDESIKTKKRMIENDVVVGVYREDLDASEIVRNYFMMKGNSENE